MMRTGKLLALACESNCVLLDSGRLRSGLLICAGLGSSITALGMCSWPRASLRYVVPLLSTLGLRCGLVGSRVVFLWFGEGSG